MAPRDALDKVFASAPVNDDFPGSRTTDPVTVGLMAAAVDVNGCRKLKN